LPARGPAVGGVAVAHQPEGRPQAGPRRHLDSGLEGPAELAEPAPGRDPAAAEAAGRRPGRAGPAGPDDQVRAAVLEDLLRGVGVVLQLPVAPAAAPEVMSPPGRVRRRSGRAVKSIPERHGAGLAGPPRPARPPGPHRLLTFTSSPVTTIRQGVK